MTAVISNVGQAVISDERSPSMPLVTQITMMTWRNLLIIFRTPAVLLPTLFISVFFLLVNNASFKNAAEFIPGLSGSSYLAFIIPFSVVSTALSGSGLAGQNLVRDIENGYFDKLLLTPISRVALLMGPILSGAVFLVLQTAIVLALGFVMGLNSETGIGGIVILIGLALVVGLGFGGVTVGVALRTGNSAATQSAGFLFFPLSFLTSATVPLDMLSGWIKTAATLNPVTYVLDAMRSVLITGYEGDVLLKGLLACLIMFAVPFLFALTSLRARTSRK